jgi:hypothetical protein
VELLSRVSRVFTLVEWGFGYFRYAASTISSHGWLTVIIVYIMMTANLRSQEAYLKTKVFTHSLIVDAGVTVTTPPIYLDHTSSKAGPLVRAPHTVFNISHMHTALHALYTIIFIITNSK